MASRSCSVWDSLDKWTQWSPDLPATFISGEEQETEAAYLCLNVCNYLFRCVYVFATLLDLYVLPLLCVLRYLGYCFCKCHQYLIQVPLNVAFRGLCVIDPWHNSECCLCFQWHNICIIEVLKCIFEVLLFQDLRYLCSTLFYSVLSFTLCFFWLLFPAKYMISWYYQYDAWWQLKLVTSHIHGAK